MFKNRVAAGIIAGFPLAIAFAVYVFLRGNAVIAQLARIDALARIAHPQWAFILIVVFTTAALLLGAISGLVYSWMDSPTQFIGAVASTALVVTVLAMLVNMPMVADVILLSVVIAAVLSLMVPLMVEPIV